MFDLKKFRSILEIDKIMKNNGRLAYLLLFFVY